VIVEALPDAVAVTFCPTKLMRETIFAEPTIEPSSVIVIPLIALAGAASTQSTPEPVDVRTWPAPPD
jgi:hypothetical protein